MLTIQGEKTKPFCDGVSRRSFLKIGALGLGGAALPEILRAEAASQPGRKPGDKAVIMIFLAGGPPHQDMWDLKPDAPSEYRGEFQAIRTNVPGMQICEEFPRLARMADKFALVRSVIGAEGPHDAYQCLTGKKRIGAPQGGWPSIGSVMSKVHGASNDSCPPFVGMQPKVGHEPWADPGKSGYLGPAHSPFTPFKGGGSQDMVLKGVTLDRLRDRRTLLGSFDQMRREVDNSGMMEGLDTFNQQAFGVLTSSRLAEALDISKEPQGIVDRYGKGKERLKDDGCWSRMDQFLMARRLVEAGCRCVTIGFSRWDWHSNNFGQAREEFPLLDQGVSALVDDLHERGLDKDVTVIVWGEFGRTPLVNKQGGRDHWPRVSAALLAGGGMKTGQVVGATDRLGGEATERPVDFQEIFATLYHNVGIDTRRTTLTDLTGRPQYIVDPSFAPLPELIA